MSQFMSILPPGSSFLTAVLSTLNWPHVATPGRATSYDKLDSISTATLPKELCQFDIDRESGFLPSEPPLDRLPAAFEPWESALTSASEALSLGEENSADADAKRESSRQWRVRVQNMPIISTSSLYTYPAGLQRAHHVLAFLVHFYMHSMPPERPSKRLLVPASLAVPLVAVSDALGIAPILTFADTVLWNWRLRDPTLPLSPENLEPQTLFTQGADEQNFYKCCATIELRGVEALQIIMDYDALSATGEEEYLEHFAESLDRLSIVIDDLTNILQSVRSSCDPHAFYFKIRPWFRGSDANGPDSPGWIYEGIDPKRRLELSGPSAGQSSTMHALDLFLGVDHELSQPRRLPAPSEQNRRADHTFMNRMRKYMPGQHQSFLKYLATHPRPIRELARRRPQILQQPYDSVVMALKRFRDQHMRIACLYVVTMSRSTAAVMHSNCPVGAMMATLQQEKNDQLLRQPVRGTGGNELSCLLKASRDATARTVLSGNIN